MHQIGRPFNPFRVFYGIFIPEALLQYSEISNGAKLCYGVLCRHAGEKGRCFPSQEALAIPLGGSVRNIRRYLQELESKGFIRIIQLGLRRSNRYEFLWHEIFDGSERTDPSGQDRPILSVPERTRPSGPLGRESFKKAAAARESASSSPNPSFFTDERRSNKSLSRIRPDEAEPYYEWLREREQKAGTE